MAGVLAVRLGVRVRRAVRGRVRARPPRPLADICEPTMGRIRLQRIAGHNLIGHNYIGHNFMGHSLVCHNYIFHNYGEPQAHLQTRIGQGLHTVGKLQPRLWILSSGVPTPAP